jgi:IS30 family transposase
MTLTAIAQQIGRSASTVSPEVWRNSGLTGYGVIMQWPQALANPGSLKL